MGEHTPPPWKWTEDGLLYGPNGELILNVHAVSINDQPLIAAAPNLLAACKATEAAYQHAASCPDAYAGSACIHFHQMMIDAQELRQAAIAKAKGAQ